MGHSSRDNNLLWRALNQKNAYWAYHKEEVSHKRVLPSEDLTNFVASGRDRPTLFEPSIVASRGDWKRQSRHCLSQNRLTCLKKALDSLQPKMPWTRPGLTQPRRKGLRLSQLMTVFRLTLGSDNIKNKCCIHHQQARVLIVIRLSKELISLVDLTIMLHIS